MSLEDLNKLSKEEADAIVNDEADKAVVRTRMLRAIEGYSSFRVQREDFNELMVDMDYNIDFDQYRIMLRAYMLAEQIAEDTYVGWREVPVVDSTFQMFKETNQDKWWMRWFVKRYPIKIGSTDVKVEVVVDRYLKYPDMVIPGNGRAIIHELVREK